MIFGRPACPPGTASLGRDGEELAARRIAELLGEMRAGMFSHIQKEEQVLFPFIAQMDQGSVAIYPPAHACFRSVSYPVFMMVQEHETIDYILAEFRRLTHGFEPPTRACVTHIALIAGFRAFEIDHAQHVHLENDVLFPRAIQMEAELNTKR